MLSDGTISPFFVKVMSRDIGRKMLNAEFQSMTAIHNLLPDFVPLPFAWGSYESVPETHFILSEYREMILDMPDPGKFADKLAALHQKSVSPNGKFGFHTTTYPGNLPQYTDWEASWETFFAKSMRQALDLEIEARGYDPEFDELIPVLFDEVIPRLLRPLESEGRTVKPSLVHGDLWFANSGIDGDSGEPLVFDACVLYAHNECKRANGPQSWTILTGSRRVRAVATGMQPLRCRISGSISHTCRYISTKGGLRWSP